MKNVRLGDFLTDEQIEQVRQIGPNRARLQAEVIEPNINNINVRLGQENDPAYLAYTLVFVLSSVSSKATIPIYEERP